jgi:hypothetical protein
MAKLEFTKFHQGMGVVESVCYYNDSGDRFGQVARVANEPAEFVSEALTPVAGKFDASAMSRGEPGLPRQFDWRKTRYDVVKVISTWKTSTADRGEMYLRRHWFSIETSTGDVMTIYCERQARSEKAKSRWWLYSIKPAGKQFPSSGTPGEG